MNSLEPNPLILHYTVPLNFVGEILIIVMFLPRWSNCCKASYPFGTIITNF